MNNIDELTAQLGISKAEGHDITDSLFILNAYERFGDFTFVIGMRANTLYFAPAIKWSTAIVLLSG
jgi:hypothetical protein